VRAFLERMDLKTLAWRKAVIAGRRRAWEAKRARELERARREEIEAVSKHLPWGMLHLRQLHREQTMAREARRVAVAALYEQAFVPPPEVGDESCDE